MGEDFKDKKIALLGLGVEGFSSLKFFSKRGAQVSVRDKRVEADFDVGIMSEAKKHISDFVFGSAYLQNLLPYDFIVRSPSIRPDLPEILEASRSGVKITSNVKTFFDLCPANIIGVTGTKGKGTTTVLISEMLKKERHNVFVGGNIGKPPLDFIEDLDSDSWVILEMSSFQLMDMEKSPHIAVVLMATREHLDWHKDSEEYIEAKANIVSHQTEEDFAVINTDYPGSSGFSDKTPAKKVFVSLFKEQDSGVYLKEEVITRSLNGKTEQILSASEVYLRGRHNIENITAAAAAASLVEIKVQEIAEVAKTFEGLPHRLEFVREVETVKYYNDSFSTTPETAIAAIGSFSEPIILIIGGSDKYSDYAGLGSVINKAENIDELILIGETADKIERVVDSNGKYRGKIAKGLATMEEVVKVAKSKATPRSVVLLSPASASFGMFKNYKDRGDLFKKEVMNLSLRPSD